ncbi:hypothetical protein GOHSU_03_00230 [Gordonia hirsuta DSM 44140 = NBRC 16056]|uniref:Uncharacterized protein n=1 Tax=Gordonia hirsuta DSM 44140 = NBRC 16056 TaxID=1121927 RepID=L7L5B8_9ACTN|nr:hypothetical protein [Gordonia hirsuta]GAC56129.1 hypothetical protein GOHSU_03_00230 [Gordonia hirsuta DSM 44140 = NBRC 16056]
MSPVFDDDDLEAYYAEIEARTAARQRPRRRPRASVDYRPPRCPTPEKICYPTLAAVTGAILAISAAPRASPSLRSYECECGAWHLTRSQRF